MTNHHQKHFTIYGDKHGIDQRIRTDMGIICNELTNRYKEIISIILNGGFGRGEGTVVISENGVQPINDYDIVIVVERAIELKELENLREYLANKVRIRQIDFEVVNIKSLPKLRLSMANYDLKYGSKVIYGEKEVLGMIPEMDARKIPLIEGRTPLFLYLISLLQAVPSGDESWEERFWSFQQISKSILGWSTALLILKGLYDTSYEIRAQRFISEFASHKPLCELVKWATDVKLRPKVHYDLNLFDLWHKANRVHLAVLRYYLSHFYKRREMSFGRISRYYKYNFKNILYTTYFALKRNRSYNDRIHLDLGEMFLCAAISKCGISQHYLERARRELSRVNDSFESSDSWDILRKKVMQIEPRCVHFQAAGNVVFRNAGNV